MEPFYVEVSRVGWARWKWTGWDDGGIAVASGEALTEARADAAARAWVRDRYRERVRPETTNSPSTTSEEAAEGLKRSD